ncbi:hypothetical protein ACQPYA_15115 [Micromonospora sp. CA-263727]|uniref:hypothetical protein n=1 Tax=Micromonospora sp. CA-263727 TaxID=3239967 RepID=UPI003D8B4F58
MPVPSLASSLSDSVCAAATRLGLADFAPQVRRSEHADFQADGVLAAARALGRRPRDIAAELPAGLPAGDLVAAATVAGPGFVNLELTDRALLAQLADRLGGGWWRCRAATWPPRTARHRRPRQTVEM